MKETQIHADLMAQGTAVLKQAHKKGVELEYILEVRFSFFFPLALNVNFFHSVCL